MGKKLVNDFWDRSKLTSVLLKQTDVLGVNSPRSFQLIILDFKQCTCDFLVHLIKDNFKTIKNINEEVSSCVAIFNKHNSVCQCMFISNCNMMPPCILGVEGIIFENFNYFFVVSARNQPLIINSCIWVELYNLVTFPSDLDCMQSFVSRLQEVDNTIRNEPYLRSLDETFLVVSRVKSNGRIRKFPNT